MPYVDRGTRDDLRKITDAIAETPVESPGELNYCVTQLVVNFLANDPAGPESYSRYNAAVGALECAKLELYRRLVTPYEVRKIRDNGDVY